MWNFLRNTILLTGLALLQFACEHSPDKKNESPIEDLDAPPTMFSLDSLRTISEINRHPRQKPIDFDAFKVLRKIIQEESDHYFKKPFDLADMTISHSDSIAKYTYITELFHEETLASIAFYGNKTRNESYKHYLPIGAMLTIEFNENGGADKAFNKLENYQSEDRRAITSIFKPGGMAFVLEDQLCLYSINACSEGYKNIQRIDSVIFHQVYYNENFDRLHARCGAGPFKRIIN